ncbi:MAG: DUF6788 family protein [Alphaproteobacteria bacterium]
MSVKILEKKLIKIKKRIEKIKAKLILIKEMRPGSLTKQYKNPQKKKGGFYQLSYTHKMRSRTEYIRPQFVKKIGKQIKSYKEFKKLMEEWIDLGIDYSKIKIEIEKNIK